MSLPLQAVERLFERLTATYGRQFLGLYEGLDANAIKAAWAHELAGFGGNLHAIAWALENLPARAPNAVEFRFLCRLAPAQQVQALTEPAATPERVRQELAKLGKLTEKPLASHGRDWARRIVARAEAGDRVTPITLTFARQALGLRGRLEQ